jgi:hypothetical protein
MSDISSYEQHFNNLQMKLRGIASTWMLTSFGAIAFLLVKEIEAELIFNRYNLINLISAMSVTALFVLWLIDQLAYQRLLNSCLVVDLYSEHKDKTKPPIKAMMAYAAKTGMTKYYNWFYFLPMLFFTVFSVVAVFLNITKMPENYEFYTHNKIFGILFVLVSMIIWIVAVCMRKEVPYVKLAEAFVSKQSEQGFVDVVSGNEDALKMLISNYDPN